MQYTAVYQQKETGHGEKQISSSVGVVSLSWGGNFPAIGLIHSAPFNTEVQSAMISVKFIYQHRRVSEGVSSLQYIS